MGETVMTPNRYGIRVLWSEEDGAFIATCPDFEGLSAFGDSKAEALEEMETVLRMEVEAYEAEGRTLPAPRLFPQYSGQFRLRLPSSLHARLVEQAEAEGVSLNTLVTSYLAERSGE